MPLDSKGGKRLMRDRLDRAVGSAGKDFQPPTQGFDGLVVRAVDREARAVQRTQQSRCGMDNVQMVAAAHLGVAQNVLVQRAAEIDVEELQAAADADDGLSRAQKFVNERKLAFVTRFIDISRAVDLLAIKARVNVAPAGQQKEIRLPWRFYAACADERERIFVIFQVYR